MPSNVEAGGLLVYNHGEDIVEIGNVVEEEKSAVQEATGKDVAVGYIHNAFGLFWLNIWTWDGRFCLYTGDQYWEIEPEQAAMLLNVPVDSLQKPLFYRFPPGLIVLLAIAAFYITSKSLQAVKGKKVQALFEDTRYQRALEMFGERTKERPEVSETDVERGTRTEKALEEAVVYLRGEGIPDEEARQNLTTLINVIIASQSGGQRAAAES
jgi:hypothetical protein